MDVAIALSLVPVIVGLAVLALRVGLPPNYETPAAIVLGVAISLGYALAGQLPRRHGCRRRLAPWGRGRTDGGRADRDDPAVHAGAAGE